MAAPVMFAGVAVRTPYGDGVIVYARMMPPSFTEPAAYSVRLDKHSDRAGYTGTIVAADQVERLTDAPA